MNEPTFAPAPGVLTWYKVYCVVMLLMYLVVAGLGAVMIIAGIGEEDGEVIVMGLVYVVMGGLLFIPFLLALFFRPQPWTWVYHTVLICLGMTSCCFLPACIPLLIYWIKPECKAYFGRAT